MIVGAAAAGSYALIERLRWPSGRSYDEVSKRRLSVQSRIPCEPPGPAWRRASLALTQSMATIDENIRVWNNTYGWPFSGGRVVS